ncbi:MAG: potassium channel family protein [Beutenbergiaceae bacterium]
MRVVIAGAGSVGRSIARELLNHGHQVTLIEKAPAAMRVSSVAEAEWLQADACEISALDQARLDDCDVVVAATGDDKANLVVSLLAKTEYAVPRTVARVNNPKNEWMFDDAWGVDVPVSTPRIMTALVEEAVTIGDLVRIFTFHQSGASMYEITLPDGAAVVGQRVATVAWPSHAVLAAIIRGDRPIPPSPDDTLEAGDELLLISSSEDPAELESLQALLADSPESTSTTTPAPTAEHPSPAEPSPASPPQH